MPTSSQNSEKENEAENLNNELNEISIWIDETLPKLLKTYNSNDVYNADETFVYFDSKERLTVLLCVNMSGTDKLLPLVIGNHDLLNNNNDINYIKCNNNKASMNRLIFGNWLEKLDKNINGRKIILFIDRNASHTYKDLPKFDNIKISFIPAKTTAIFQPLDKGIIQQFKIEYKKLSTIPNYELDVIKKVLMGWKAVTEITIEKGFEDFSM